MKNQIEYVSLRELITTFILLLSFIVLQIFESDRQRDRIQELNLRLTKIECSSNDSRNP